MRNSTAITFGQNKITMHIRSILNALVFVFTGSIAVNVNAQTAPVAIADSLQYILDHALPSGFANAGAIMEVHVPGQWTWKGATGSGIAGITVGQQQTIASGTDRFRVGSITKTMVATCILKLEEAGQLSIEDPISLYLRPTLVNDTIASSDTVRIRHLLNHTSGIANSGDNTSCQQNVLTNPLGSHSLEEAIYCGASQGEVFPPEFAWAYSNTNYSILAMIIQNVTGQSYRDYLTQTVITPLGLTDTEIPLMNQLSGPHMGCYWNIGNWIDLTIINPTTYTGWADVVSSTADLNVFYKALRNGQLVNNTSLAKMHTMYPGTFGYGLGLDFYTITAVDYIGHYGEVANTSGMFFGNTASAIAPNGYYISYNFNVQGADMQNMIDVPVLQLLNSAFTATAEISTKQKQVRMYPNPATALVQLELPGNAETHITVSDATGRVVKVLTVSSGTRAAIDCAAMERGIYQVTVTNAQHTETHKLILN
jgi:D-alanyl-D-alanine carboxypeptidase